LEDSAVQSAIEQFRPQLERLDWSKGLTKDQIMQQVGSLPMGMLDRIPGNKTFYSFNDFWRELQSMSMGFGGGQTGRE
jgi:hypothetical protein